MKTAAIRFHDISVGHTVTGHESKCAHLHGHNYRIHFKLEVDELDLIGRVLDFSIIKEKLCQWLEEVWDHKFLINANDPRFQALYALDQYGVVATSFNPTAENMAQYLLEVIGPSQLQGTGARLTWVKVEETFKCSAEASVDR